MTVANSPAAWSERAAEATPWEAALWSEHRQTARFQAVLQHLNLRAGDTVLDYGCATGRFCEFLPLSVDYYGHDWAPAMRERAAAEHPRGMILDELPDELFDHVVAIGVFNLSDGWWKQRTWDTLGDLWTSHTRRTLAVSLYRGTDPRCLTYSATDLAATAMQFGAVRYSIDSSYLDNDSLLVMHR